MSCQFTNIPTETNKVRLNLLEPSIPARFNPCLLFHGCAYLSAKKPTTFKYFGCFLFKLELEDGLLKVSRPMRDSAVQVTGLVLIQMYDKDNKELDSIDEYQIDFPATTGEMRSNKEYSTNQFAFQNADYDSRRNHCEFPPNSKRCYVTVRLLLISVDYWPEIFNAKFLDLHWKKKEYTRIECINGSVRVLRKSLSDASVYFEKLFSGRKLMKYKVDIDLLDLMYLLSILPPYNYIIRTGATYGAIRRISEKLKCYKLAELCDEHMKMISSVAPLAASFMAFEGGVEIEEDLYLKEKETTDTDVLKNKLAHETRKLRNALYPDDL